MSFIDAQKLHVRAIVDGIFGEVAIYRPGKTTQTQSVRVRVRREPLDTIDGVVKNHLLIRASKADIPTVLVHEDTFEIGGKRYTVMDVLESMPTHWLLECAQ